MRAKKIDSESQLHRIIETAIPSKEEAIERINDTEQPLNIKFGADGTGSNLHFGHAVNLWAARTLQEMGHKIHFILGDTTAAVGDPSGRNKERPILPPEKIERNITAFRAQLFTVLLNDPKLIQVHRNSDWYNKMNVPEFLDKVLRLANIKDVLDRKAFQDRMRKGLPLSAAESVYALLQGYDSVHLESDMALAGDDQLKNEEWGRALQKKHGQNPQMIVTTKILPGIDGGLKQSKSLGNYIGLTHTSEEQFKRIMSIPDKLIADYFYVYTDLTTSEIHSLLQQYTGKERSLKLILAKAMLQRYHNPNTIGEAEESFERHARERKLVPDSMPHFFAPSGIVDLLQFAADHLQIAKKEFLRRVDQRGVHLDGRKLSSEDIKERRIPINLSSGQVIVLKYGKDKWIKIEGR